MPFQTKTLAAVLGPLLLIAPASQAQESPLLGFTSESSDAQRQLEALFDEAFTYGTDVVARST